MTAELPEGLLLEDKNNWIRTIKTSLGHISTIENCKKEDEYYRIYQNTTIFKFQIIDIDLGGTEREGSEIAASIAENRQKRGKKLSPIILISAYQTGLDKAKNDSLISKYFDYFLNKERDDFSEKLEEAVQEILTRGDNTCNELEDFTQNTIDDLEIKNKISHEDAEKIIMDTQIPEDEILIDDQFIPFKEGFARINTIRSLLEDCKKAQEVERREFIRQLIVKRVYAIKSKNLRK